MTKDLVVGGVMELKPCPFCAGTHITMMVSIFDQYMLACGKCGTCGPWMYDEEAAIDAWNDRNYYGDTREKE